MHTPSSVVQLSDADGIDPRQLAQLRKRAPVAGAQWLPASAARLAAPPAPLGILELRGHWPSNWMPPLTEHLIVVALAPAAGCRLWVDAQGPHGRDLGVGQALVLPALEPAWLHWPDTHHLLVLLLPPRLLERGSEAGTPAPRLQGGVAENDPLLLPLAQALLAAARPPSGSGTAALDHLAQALLAHLRQHHCSTAAAAPTLGQLRLERALALLNTRLAEGVDLAQLAQAAGCSVHHLAHLFKAQMGVSPMRYLRQLRMERARELVETTRLSMAEIGERVGVADPTHFSHAFRAHWKVTPSALRRPV